jgi:hypothetical protein
MRYLSPALVHGGIEGEQARRIWQAYRQRLHDIWPDLSADLRVLAETELNDALIRRTVLVHQARELILELRCGCMKSGYFDLNLRYRGVALSNADAQVLRTVVSYPSSAVMTQEIDLGEGGGYVHRLLFIVNNDSADWYEDNIEIRFSHLELESVPCTDRASGEYVNRFLELDHKEG